MCWRTRFTAVKRIAENDIRAIKIMNVHEGEYYSYFRGYKTPIGELLKSEVFVKCTEEITIGLHSYNPNAVTIDVQNWLFSVNLFDGSCWGFRNEDLIMTLPGVVYGNACICDCVIPKGAEYYENESGEFVSNQLIIKSVIAELKNNCKPFEISGILRRAGLNVTF